MFRLLAVLLAMTTPYVHGGELVCPPKVFPFVPIAGYTVSKLVRLKGAPAQAAGLLAQLDPDEFPRPITAWYRTESGLIVYHQAYEVEGSGTWSGFSKSAKGWKLIAPTIGMDCAP
jgi:hypothetical protein